VAAVGGAIDVGSAIDRRPGEAVTLDFARAVRLAGPRGARSCSREVEESSSWAPSSASVRAAGSPSSSTRSTRSGEPPPEPARRRDQLLGSRTPWWWAHDPVGSTGRFWRGNIHTHSNLSTACLSRGGLPPLPGRGLRLLSLSDHFACPTLYPIADTPRSARRLHDRSLAELHSGAMANAMIWSSSRAWPLTSRLPHAGVAAGRGPGDGPEIAARGGGAGPSWRSPTRNVGADAGRRAEHDGAATPLKLNHGCTLGADRRTGSASSISS
jgi:hypothetical protein